MTLLVYEKPTESTFLSIDGTFTNPFSMSIDGRTGGTLDFQLFIRNDDATKWYDGISVAAISGTDNLLVNGSLGFAIKLETGNKRPTREEWNLVVDGASAIFSEGIGSSVSGDITVYLPFWIQVRVPANQPAAVIKGIVLQISVTEHLV